MCNFLSALIVRNGDILTHPMLDSHHDLVTYFKLPDSNGHIPRFVKVELTPTDNWLDPATWKWQVDEETLPRWWEDGLAVQAEAALRRRAKSMIVTDDRTLIVDGCWIVGGKAKIRDVRSGRIVRVQDSASISNVWGSASIRDVGGSASIRDVGGSVVLDSSAKRAVLR